MRERVDEEESVAWMADPFPDVSVIYSNVHPSIVVEMDEEDEEDEETMERMDASKLACTFDEAEVIVKEVRMSSPSV